jgi:DNA-binding response OmpR family regulator
MSGNPDNLRQAGFDGYLEKPFSMRELSAAVENARR